MKVSVIVPNYNHEKFLKRRIESILTQTYEDFEIIILDDCSTDESREIIEFYRSNPKISEIIFNETNSGSVFRQWLKGLQIAKGELIWMAESDDWCENNFLEVLVNGIEKNPACVVAFSQSYCIGNNNEIKWQSRHPKPEYIKGNFFFKERLVYGCTIFNASMAIFKKEAALRVPAELTKFKLCGDWFFWINIVRHGDVFISDKVLNYYRRADNSLTEKAYATGYNFIEELNMFQLIKAQKKERVSIINDSVFNRYNSFQRRKNKFSQKEARLVFDAFYHFSGGYFLFKILLLNKRINLLVRKIRLRIKVTFQNSRPSKLKPLEDRLFNSCS
ncbi:MAG TPA: glycosyltransferase family 2 protein [Chitinophagaceae bacterium]